MTDRSSRLLPILMVVMKLHTLSKITSTVNASSSALLTNQAVALLEAIEKKIPGFLQQAKQVNLEWSL